MRYIERHIGKLLADTVDTRPLVYLNGPRQVGKSTLAERFATSKAVNYISFDSPLILAAASSDPVGFIKSLPRDRLNIVDEVQLVPETFRQFKTAVDEIRKTDENSGKFLLTGSAGIMVLPQLSQALAGRMAILTLLPFSVAERAGTGKNFIESLWADDLSYGKYETPDLAKIISDATYPEISLNRSVKRRQWFDDYLSTILQRDIKSLADIRNPQHIIQLLVSLSQRVGSLLNNTSVMKETGLDAKTYAKYKGLITGTFLTFELEAWSKTNKLNKRFVKQNKLYFNDTNLLCYVMRRDIFDVYKNDPNIMGHVFENFIAAEIVKNAQAAGGVYVSHFNISGGKEVDFVLESDVGETVGIEVKLDASLSERDFANMRTLQEVTGDRFKKGIVVYTGNELVPFKDSLWAVPVNYLWE
jgi:predicted AAA+ superfamily ATPase